jgi:predicted esterase
MVHQIDQQTFETSVSVPKPVSMQEKAFTGAAGLCRESWIVPNSARDSLLLEGNRRGGADLAVLMKKTYVEMSADPALRRMLDKRTLGHALRAQFSGQGHYYLSHVPDSPVVVFLHGYGGNFLFYLWTIKRVLPTCTLVHPSCGIDWRKRSATENTEFIADLMEDLQRRIGTNLTNVWPAGISNGGSAAFDIADQCPERFRGLVSIASSPDGETIQSLDLPRGYPVLMINGMKDDRFPIEDCSANASLLLQA